MIHDVLCIIFVLGFFVNGERGNIKNEKEREKRMEAVLSTIIDN